MDIAFIMGMILGFLIGVGFCILFTHMLGRQLLTVLNGSTPKKKKRRNEEEDADDPVNYWKPPGWRPDSHND